MTFNDLQVLLHKSMKEKQNVKVDAIKDIINNAVNISIEKKQKGSISDDVVEQAIRKSYKQCKEQIETCPAHRNDLIGYYNEKFKCIAALAPKMMSKDEVKSVVYEALAALDNVNKGIAMKTVMPLLKGKAEGKDVSDAVDEYLEKER